MSLQELLAKKEEMEKTLPSIADLDDWIPCAIQRKPAVVLASKTDNADRIFYQNFPAEKAWAKVYDYLALMERIRDTFISEPLEEMLLADTEELQEQIEERAKSAQETKEAMLQEVWDETDEYIRRRIRNPSEFEEGSFRTVWFSQDQGIKAVTGRPKGEDKTAVQSILFSKDKGWTRDKAETWIKDHPDLQVSESEPVQ